MPKVRIFFIEKRFYEKKVLFIFMRLNTFCLPIDYFLYIPYILRFNNFFFIFNFFRFFNRSLQEFFSFNLISLNYFLAFSNQYFSIVWFLILVLVTKIPLPISYCPDLKKLRVKLILTEHLFFSA